MSIRRQLVALVGLASVVTRVQTAHAQATVSLTARLAGFDGYMATILKDWNVPGIGVGIVVKDKLVFAKGYGYRDWGKKLPFTPTTAEPIASNTKLFTAVAAGMLADEGMIDLDKPIRDFVPSIRFYNEDLNRSVTMHDMLSHRTGISRHDLIWYKSDLTQKELFQRLRYLEPTEPIRTTFLYNNMMYSSVGHAIELLSGTPWQSFVTQRILTPLGMSQTTFTIADMRKLPEPAVPYTERRDGTELYSIPYYSDAVGVAPAGAINSTIVDMSKWLIALMNGGRVDGKQVIPSAVLKQTLAPSIALPNTSLEVRGYGEFLNTVYGMGRQTGSYRGHLLALHGGDLPGFHTQISMMPTDSIGVIVFVIGDHAAPLYDVVTFDVYERLLGLSLTPWSERRNAIRAKNKAAYAEARSKAGGGRVSGTHPSHALEQYVGQFEHPAYGILEVTKGDTSLMFDFHKIKMPLSHFHYDRFDTPDDEQDGKWSVNFLTNPQGEIDKAEMSLDEAGVVFTRRVPPELSQVATLQQYTGKYVTPNGGKFDVVVRADSAIAIRYADGTFQGLLPWQPRRFHVKKFADETFEFIVVDGKVTAMKQTDPEGEYTFIRQKP